MEHGKGNQATSGTGSPGFKSGDNPEPICISLGESRFWLYKWVKRFDEVRENSLFEGQLSTINEGSMDVARGGRFWTCGSPRAFSWRGLSESEGSDEGQQELMGWRLRDGGLGQF